MKLLLAAELRLMRPRLSRWMVPAPLLDVDLVFARSVLVLVANCLPLTVVVSGSLTVLFFVPGALRVWASTTVPSFRV